MSQISPEAMPYAAALADLTDIFLEKNGGAFPLDNHGHRDVMARAYALIGQPRTPDRRRLLDSMRVVGYRAGLDRNEPEGSRASHTYAMTADGELYPMCPYGWNRSDGASFSILRQPPGTEGNCKSCRKNIEAKRLPLFDGAPHKTKWL